MGSSKNSYICLLFFVIVFFLGSALFWFVSLSIRFGDSPTADSIGAAFGQALGMAVIYALTLVVAIGLTVIFLILFIIWIVKKAKN
ncbi:hypothetical protein [Candidatus Harpocratesius sp.]